MQYPKVLKNWWCDDWITNVYGSKRSKKLKSQEVKHLISGTRYQVSLMHCASWERNNLSLKFQQKFFAFDNDGSCVSLRCTQRTLLEGLSPSSCFRPPTSRVPVSSMTFLTRTQSLQRKHVPSTRQVVVLAVEGKHGHQRYTLHSTACVATRLCMENVLSVVSVARCRRARRLQQAQGLEGKRRGTGTKFRMIIQRKPSGLRAPSREWKKVSGVVPASTAVLIP